MATSTGNFAGAYTLDNAWEKARQRLRQVEVCYDAGTTRRLRSLGVATGWRCLEAGAGGGSVASFLCREVGASGRVTAVDIDTRFLSEIDATNLDVIQGDITETELPRDTFDLVHCRALLMHVPDRERVLDSLVAALRPGGWLLVEEADHFPVAAFGSDLHTEVVDSIVIKALTRAGVDWTFARHLPAHLQRRGLKNVAAESEVSLFEGGSPMAELLRLTVAQAWGGGLTGGMTNDQIAAWNRLIVEPRRWFHSFALVGAWGRR